MYVYSISNGFIVYTLIYCHLSVSIKIPSPHIDQKISNRVLNECQRCKILTDSFNHWLDKTSRGKFEGGDAAWEEAKLKSYARSEIRLVEVQEGLCSELKKHQDQCYSTAEEAEQALEKWWFHKDSHYFDLYTWLCVENLKYCCPQKHFGVHCNPCPLDKNNQVCSGHGKCDGEGTRKGNGSCHCHRGFAGILCEDCANNFYRHEDSCEVCHQACDGCSGAGVAACNTCSKGWQLISGVCADVNECSDPSSCKSNQYCVNKEGSFKCIACDKSCQTCAGAGSQNCTSCASESALWSGVCVDDNLKGELFLDALKRAALYLGLFVTTYFVYQTSKLLASVIIMAIASYIYFSEKISKMTVVDIFLNYYL